MSDHGSLDRRSFVAGVLGAGGVLALAASDTRLAAAQTDPTVCSSPIAFRPGMDTRPITERRTVVQLAADAAWKAQMMKGYAAMRAFNASDPRSLVQQGNMHNLMCSGGSKEVHGSDRFLAWHRCFVYFQERIVSSNIAYSGSGAPTPKPPDNDFRLAMWNWEGASSTPVFPAAFASGSLNDPNRANSPATFYAGEGNINPALNVASSNPFRLYGFPVGSGQGGSPVLENGPHGKIHMSTGKQPKPWHDMGSLSTAALDPVFCAHHGNIDRVWAWWQALHNNVTPDSINPATHQKYDPAWIQNKWFFTDWDGKCYTITPESVIDYRTNLRYAYPAPPRPAPIRSFAVAVSGSTLKASSEAGQSISMVLENVEIPPPGTGRFNLVATVNGEARSIGRFAIFSHAMSESSKQSVLATISPEGAAALQTGTQFRIVSEEKGGTVRLNGTVDSQAGTPLRLSAATLLVE